MARNFNYTKIGWQDGTVLQPAKVNVQGTEYEVESAVISGNTPINSTNLDKMDSAIEDILETELPNVINIELLDVTDTAPSECSTGDKYYNTTDKKIYTATGENTWSSTGEDPLDGILYVLFSDNSIYAWNGTNLVGVGASGGIILSDTYTTNASAVYNAPYINTLQGTILFEDTAGDRGSSITLNDSISNYTTMTIFFRCPDSRASSSVTFLTSKPNVGLRGDYVGASNQLEYISYYTLSGNTLSLSSYMTKTTVKSTGALTIDTSSNNVFILKVVGYK